MSQRAARLRAPQTGLCALVMVLSAGCSRTELSTAEHLIRYQDEIPVPSLSNPTSTQTAPTTTAPVTPTAPVVTSVPTAPATTSVPATMAPVMTTPPAFECPAIEFESCVRGPYCDEGAYVSCGTDEFGCATELTLPNAAECEGTDFGCKELGIECDAGVACDAEGCVGDCIPADYDISYEVGVGVHSGSTVGASPDIRSDCALGARSPDVVYHWAAPNDGCYQVDTFGANYDSAIGLRSDCPDFEELLCNDDAGSGSGVAFEAKAEEEFFFVIDGFASGSAGEYVLNIRDCGEVCDGLGLDEDEDGAVDCSDPECQYAPPCIDEVCGNDIDDDGDTLFDCYDGDCFGHSTCFEYCDDGIDNDADGDVDCLDSTCVDDDACSCTPECCVDGALQPIAGCEACTCSQTCDPDAGACTCPLIDVEAMSVIDAVLASGSTVGASADVQGSCGVMDAGDIVVSWVAPTTGCIRFSTQGSDFDSLLHIHTCDGVLEELACDDDLGGLGNAEIDLSVTTGTQYYIVVDGYDPAASGNYVLNAWICP